MKEREISIVDLMVDILLHWRMFIIWMVAGAVVFGVFGYVRSGNIAKQQKEQADKIQQSPEEWFTEEEILNATYVVNYEKAYLAKATYQKESPLMQLDSNNVSKAEAIIVVEADSRQKSCDIEKVYENIAESSELFTRIAEDTGVDTVGIREILYLDRAVKQLYFDKTAVSVAIEDSKETNTFKIVAVYSDEEKCKDILESALAFLKEKHSSVESTLGKHEITVVNEAFGVVSDKEIADLQKMILDDIADMKKGISEAKKDLSDAEQKYYEFLMSTGEVEESDAEQKYYEFLMSTGEVEEFMLSTDIPSLSNIVKYVLLGAVIAAFLYTFMLCLFYIFNTKIRVTDDLQELYDISQLGMISDGRSNKKRFGSIDKWILSFQNRNRRQFSLEEELEFVAVAVKLSAGKEALQEICLVGCGLRERSLDVCEKIKARLAEDGIQVNILNNILYDARKMEELEAAKGVILVENVGSTLYDEITKELEILKRQKIKVLGGIIVE